MPRGARRCLRWRHAQAADLRLRQGPLQCRVNLRIKEGRTPHRSSRFRNSNRPVADAQILGDRSHQRGQSAGGAQQNFSRAWVFRIRRGNHHRKNLWENFIRGHTGVPLQLSPSGVSALFQNFFPKN